MTEVFEVILVLELPLELVLAALLYALPLNRREKSKWTFFLTVVALLWGCYEGSVSLLLLMRLEGAAFRLLLSLLLSTVSFGTVIAGIYAFCDVTPVGAFYYATLAYLTQHFAYCLCEFIRPGILQADISEQSIPQNLMRLFINLLIFTLVYLAALYLVSRPLFRSGSGVLGLGRSLAVLLMGLYVCLVLSCAVQFYWSNHPMLYRCCLAYAMLCCTLLLWNQVDLHNRLAQQHELDTQRQLWLRHKAQYERAQAAVKLINHKCHDLKRQLGAFERMATTAPDEQTRSAIREMEKTVSVYDSIVETGNEILDTILSEKSLQCAAQNIAFLCVADGHAVDFVDAVDLFTLLGAALDNAVEAVQFLEDTNQRTISVSAFSGQGVSILQVENYFSGSLRFEDGLPVTTKGSTLDYGTGLKSIRRTAEKYGGVVKVQAEEQIFLLRVTLPCSR